MNRKQKQKSNPFEKVLYAFFPRRCDMCADVVCIDEPRCEKCLEIPRIKGEICELCGISVDDCKCKDNPKNKPDYDCVIAPFRYEGNIITAVHKFKFGGYTELADTFAKEMLSCFNERYSDIKFDAVTYVPMSKKRERRRGYNQSLLLAEKLSEAIGIPLEHSFYKAYDAPPQRNQSSRRRRANIFGAFDIVEGIDVEGKIYLVVDDVKTTGSTLSECCAVLKTYGANQAYAIALAIR